MTAKLPLVSVIIPTYNRARFVTEAIASVLEQTFRDFEIIVVDDGSTDDTKDKLVRYRDSVSYICQENRGVSVARNTGVRASKSEWVAFLDSDDIWRPEYLAIQMEQVAAHPDVCMQSTDCESACSEFCVADSYFKINGVLRFFGEAQYLLLNRPFEFVINHGPWQVGSTVFKRRSIVDAGLFDSNVSIGEDYYLMARVALQGPFGLIKNCLVRICRREESIECLTYRIKTEPLGVMQSAEQLYLSLLTIPTLNGRERWAVKAVMSANRRSIGNFYVNAGDMRLARQAFARAVRIHPSGRSLGRWMFSLTPKSVNSYFIEFWNSRKSKSK